MFLLLIFLYLKTGIVEARTSIVYSTDDGMGVCQEALPLTISLYKKGKFHDGPPADSLKDVKGRCEPVEEENKVAVMLSPLCPLGDECLVELHLDK